MQAFENLLDITIFVPCLNEEKSVEATLDTVTTAMRELPYTYEILVVDDGSKDRTASLVEAYQAKHPDLPIRFHRNQRNRGLAVSYIDGAFLGRGKYYKQVCGDNGEPKETLQAVVSQLGKADILMPYYPDVQGKSAFRRWLSGLYTSLVNTISGYRIHYYNGLAIHLRYNVMRWGPYSFGFGFQAELITRLLDEGVPYIEIPVAATHQQKSGKNSSVNLKNFLSVGHTLTEMFIRRIRLHVV